MHGVPMGVIAEQHGHADTPMTEKHYAHLASSYVANTIRDHFPTALRSSLAGRMAGTRGSRNSSPS
jgi:hypothetical protein